MQEAPAPEAGAKEAPQPNTRLGSTKLNWHPFNQCIITLQYHVVVFPSETFMWHFVLKLLMTCACQWSMLCALYCHCSYADQSGEQGEEYETEEQLQAHILNAALDFVQLHGWTLEAISAGAEVSEWREVGFTVVVWMERFTYVTKCNCFFPVTVFLGADTGPLSSLQWNVPEWSRGPGFALHCSVQCPANRANGRAAQPGPTWSGWVSSLTLKLAGARIVHFSCAVRI